MDIQYLKHSPGYHLMFYITEASVTNTLNTKARELAAKTAQYEMVA